MRVLVVFALLSASCGGGDAPPDWVGKPRQSVDASVDGVAFTIALPANVSSSEALSGAGAREWISKPDGKGRALSVRIERRVERPSLDELVNGWENGEAYVLHHKTEAPGRHVVVMRDDTRRHVLVDVVAWRGDVTMECVATQLWNEPLGTLDATATALTSVCESLVF